MKKNYWRNLRRVYAIAFFIAANQLSVITLAQTHSANPISKNQKFEQFLPPTENLLLHFVVLREENLRNLVTFIKSECGEPVTKTNTQGKKVTSYVRKLRLCYFPAKLTAYYKIQAKIFLSKQDLIYFPEIESLANQSQTDTSKWNLTKILSQNYVLRPNPNGMNATVDQIAELLTQKKEIMKELEIVGAEMKKLSFDKNLMGYYLIPSLKASINNVTPLGAMLELFQEIKCDLKDSFCLYLKSRIGSVLNEISKHHATALTGFVERFNSYTSNEPTQKVIRLRKLLDFNLAYHSAKIENRSDYKGQLKKDIEDFVADGEGGFINDRFQIFAQHVLILSEVTHFAKHLINLSPYANELSEAKRKNAAKVLLPQVTQSIDILEDQYKLLGFDEEVGE